MLVQSASEDALGLGSQSPVGTPVVHNAHSPANLALQDPLLPPARVQTPKHTPLLQAQWQGDRTQKQSEHQCVTDSGLWVSSEVKVTGQRKGMQLLVAMHPVVLVTHLRCNHRKYHQHLHREEMVSEAQTYPLTNDTINTI